MHLRGFVHTKSDKRQKFIERKKFNTAFFLYRSVQSANCVRAEVGVNVGLSTWKVTKKILVHPYLTIWQALCLEHTDPITFIL